MSYTPSTDFIALIRYISGHARVERMPGLDYLIAGLSRAQMFLLWTGTTAPTSNKATTVWLRPASPSWVAEGAVFLYDAALDAYEPATPELWAALFGSGNFAVTFQSVGVGAAAVGSGTTLLAIERVNPATTVLTLPSVAVRNRPLQIVDWSSAVVDHQITLMPAGGETIMRLPSFELLSNAVQLAGVTLFPSVDLDGWVIAP